MIEDKNFWDGFEDFFKKFPSTFPSTFPSDWKTFIRTSAQTPQDVKPEPKPEEKPEEKPAESTSEMVRQLCKLLQCIPSDLVKAVTGILDKQRASYRQACALQGELNEIRRKQKERSHKLAIAQDKLDRIAQVLGSPLKDR